MSKTQATSAFKGGEPAVHHERAARALERLGILCYNVAKPMKECGCQETVFTNSLVGTKTGGRPASQQQNFRANKYIKGKRIIICLGSFKLFFDIELLLPGCNGYVQPLSHMLKSR